MGSSTPSERICGRSISTSGGSTFRSSTATTRGHCRSRRVSSSTRRAKSGGRKRIPITRGVRSPPRLSRPCARWRTRNHQLNSRETPGAPYSFLRGKAGTELPLKAISVCFREAALSPLQVDRVVYALGGTTPENFLKSVGIEFDGPHPRLTESFATSVPGLFLAGDLTAGKRGGSI